MPATTASKMLALQILPRSGRQLEQLHLQLP